MLEIQKLTAGYPGKPVLQDVSLSIPEGKVTVILGPNGCGKTTLLKAICGILPAKNGLVMLDGENLLGISSKLRAQKVAYLAQSRQVPDITVGRFVLHGRFPYLGYPRRYRNADYACANAAMDAMGISDLADTLLQNLSGGQRQKVYIAMALAQDAPVILLDEPTVYLDISHQLQLMQLAQDLAQQGKSVLMIMHDLPHAFQMADKLILMDAGTVVAEGSPQELYVSRAIEQVFGVRLGRTSTEGGWRYYCEDIIA